jgi:hypothetical protein
LGKSCGGNPHDKAIISATGTPHSDHPVYHPKNAADLQSDSYFWSQDSAGRWVSYDFIEMRVAVTHYILRSNSDSAGGRHLRSWVIEGSEDGGKWIEMDRRENDGSLNGAKSIGSFEVRNVIECRYVRIRPTGPNWQGNNQLYFQAFDLFGGLRVPNSMKLT